METRFFTYVKGVAACIGFISILFSNVVFAGITIEEFINTMGATDADNGNKKNKAISEKEILSYYYSGPYVHDMWGQTVELGTHNNMRVIAEHPCGDVCPAYTKRVIRYDAPLKDCVARGGVINLVGVPSGILNAADKYCVPKILNGYQ
ncbi:MAG: hypothetical protein GXP13_06295 [Gammaproteobacteria bacterium]|nr:hypothetical protein [Gammaproteobacteria bacterium]